MNRLFEINRISSCLIKESESHSVMSIGDGESEAMMEQPARRRNKGFTKNHGSNGRGSDKPVPVVKRLDPPTQGPGEEALVIPRGLAVGVEPFVKIRQNLGYAICCVHVHDMRARLSHAFRVAS